MGYCEIFTMNPISKIEEEDNQLILHTTHTTHNMYVNYSDTSFMSSLIDDMQKHVIFTDTEKDWDLMDLSLSRVKVLLECELVQMRTTTDVSKDEQNIRFSIGNLTLPNYRPNALGQFGDDISKCAIYPKILLYNGETKDATLFFYVEHIIKTRNKKIQKIIKKNGSTK